MNVIEALPFAQKVYDRSCVGCCMHIVLDDDNVDNNHVEWSLNKARERGHEDCIKLGEILMDMSKTQRLKLGSMVSR